MPAAIALYLAAEPIVRVLFQRGAFTAIDTNATAAMLAALALGLPAYVLIKVLQPSFFAREDTKTPMIFAGIAMAANVVLSIMLFTSIGATGIAIATTLSGWINVGSAASPRSGAARASRFDPSSAAASCGILAASALMGAVVFALVRLLDRLVRPGERSAGPSLGHRRLGRRLAS